MRIHVCYVVEIEDEKAIEYLDNLDSETRATGKYSDAELIRAVLMQQGITELEGEGVDVKLTIPTVLDN